MRRDLSLVALGAASALGYTLLARAAGADGFPLDDAWIHQTYARNLAQHGQWAFSVGQPSAGSTSPLWTVLLAAGYVLPLNLDYVLWAAGINAVLLGLTAWLTYRLALGWLTPGGAEVRAWWLGALVALEWHLVWAAASGMETVLYCALVMGAWLLVRGPGMGQLVAAGALVGLAVWTRPDGLILLPFCGWAAWSSSGDGPGRVKRLGLWLIGAGAVLLPYFLFNLALSGQIWPNTFFAKQAEYAPLRQLPLWWRAGQVYSAPLVGAMVLLWPGLPTSRRWSELGWAAAFLASYALRLPVTYQHGRYMIPVIPMLIAVGGVGLSPWMRPYRQLWLRAASRAWVGAVGAVTVAFWVLGARALIADVGIINREMVATARWVASNLPAGTRVAAHDIGALGYYAEVELIDLAGLVSPEVIPFIRDDARLWVFVRERGAKYVVTYPGWCPAFTRQPTLKPVFQTGPPCDPDQPNLHMAVYQVLPGGGAGRLRAL